MSLDRTEYTYTPIIKERGFNPSPVAGQIPYFADSISKLLIKVFIVTPLALKTIFLSGYLY